ncbi:hypothetical protein ACFLTU_04225 [Bacteroidota bacterium]
MQSNLKYIVIVLLLAITGCEQSGKLNDFFRPAPVQPLAEVIRTSIPIGFCAMVAMADQLGYSIPYDRIPAGDDLSLIRITPAGEFPLLYLDKACKEILILRFSADDEFSILSIFFIEDLPVSSLDRILEFHTIPVMLDEGKVKAIFASQEIYVRDSVELHLKMGPGDIRIELDRLEEPRPESTEAAIEQNAWIIDADPAGTWNLFSDDIYTITGGEQDISVLNERFSSETGIIQLAMIETQIHPDCILAPRDGFSLLREISVSTGPENSLEDMVLGTVLFRFVDECTGQVEIPLATGNFITSTGKKVNLELLD